MPSVKTTYSAAATDRIPPDLANDLVELIEMNMMGFEVIQGKSWEDQATIVLQKFYQFNKLSKDNITPLSAKLRLSLTKLLPTFSRTEIDLLTFSIIVCFKNEIIKKFPTNTIDKELLIDYFQEEFESAVSDGITYFHANN